MDFMIITLLVVICVTLYYYYRMKVDYFKNLDIPYLQGWPLLGTFGPALFRFRHFSDIMQEVYNLHPDAKYVGAFDNMTPFIVLRDLELIKSITIKNFENFPDHNPIMDSDLDPLFGGNLFSLTGEKWKEARNLLSPAFTASKMRAMFELIVDCGKNFANHLSKRPADENKMVDMKDLFTKFTNDVIATCAFGISVDTLKDPQNEFYVFGKIATNLDSLFTKIFIANICPKIFKWFNMKFVEDRIAKFFKNIIETTIAERDKKGIRRPDMLQLMMDARGKDNKHMKLDITEMTAHAFVFFFGGFDSTSTQLGFIANELAINPDVQERLQNEIDQVTEETNAELTYEAINNLPYLDAVFNESLRLHTQNPFLDRKCIKSLELPPTLPGRKPFILKPGMNVWIPANAIHRDPNYYENPNKFDPDRYYKKKVSMNNEYNLGFGIGPRACIGNRFAILETKILFFQILSKFTLKPNAKTCNPIVYDKKTFAFSPKGGFWLEIEPRQKS